jgi:hypothetical protein
VEATDAAGNVSSPSGALDLTIDSTAPAAPSTPTLTIASDSGLSNTDALTNVTTPVFTGTAETGSTVTLFDTNHTVLGSAVATGGTYSITSSTLSEGSHTVTADATDVAGNISNLSKSFTLDIDTTAPGAPTLVLANDSGVSATDHITNDPTLITAAAEPGGMLLFNVDGQFSSTTPTFAIDGSADGAHSVVVAQEDAAGNISAPTSLNFTLDTIAPHLTAVTTSASGDLEPGSTANFVFNFSEAVHVAGGTPTLSLSDGGTAVFDANATAATGDPTKMVFDYLVSANDTPTTSLAITGINQNGATISDIAGNAADVSHAATSFGVAVNGESLNPYLLFALAHGFHLT